MSYLKISIFTLSLLLGHQTVHGYYKVVSMVCEQFNQTHGKIWIHCPEETDKRSNKENKYCCGIPNKRYCCDYADKLSEDPDFDPFGRDDTIMEHYIPFWQGIMLTTSFLLLLGLCFYTLGWSILQIFYLIFCCPCCGKKQKQHYHEISIAENTSLIRNPNFFRGPPRSVVLSPDGTMGSQIVDAKPVNFVPENSYYKSPPAYNEV